MDEAVSQGTAASGVPRVRRPPRASRSTGRFLLEMLLPSRAQRDVADSAELARYRRIWWRTVLLTLLVSLAPLLVMTELNRFMYRRALITEARYSIIRALSSASRSLDFVLEERMAALKLLMQEETVGGLSDNTALGRTLRNLKHTFGGFVDLGIIDSGGTQRFYAGPYDLQGATYQDQDWFQEVAVRGTHVSEVFMGHRQIPHFVIAVRADTGDNSFVVLRATVDMDLLIKHVYVPEMGPSDDVFVVSRGGTLQTPSRHHGNLLERSSVPVPAYSPEVEIVRDYGEGGESHMLGYRYIEDSPFILMAIKRVPAEPGQWQWTRMEMWSILAVGTILISLVVLWISTSMVRQIQAADRERAEMLHKIEFTSKMATMGRLAASVAHEINNPLAIINEKAGLLEDLVAYTPDHPHREKTLRSLESIRNSVDRCGKVTHRLLGFTRRLEPRAEPIQLGGLLLDVLSFTGKETEHRNITVETHFPPGLPPVQSDRGQLQQIFLNIVSNALEAVRDGGRIDLRLSARDDGFVAVAVQDDGAGIPADKLPYIFEPYFSLKGEFGTGLGLSITYEIVRKLGGRISVESQEGSGTTVTVVLPAATGTGG